MTEKTYLHAAVDEDSREIAIHKANAIIAGRTVHWRVGPEPEPRGGNMDFVTGKREPVRYSLRFSVELADAEEA